MNNCKIIYSILENSGGLLSSTLYGVVFTIIFIGIYLVIFFKIDDFFKRIFAFFMIAWCLYIAIPFSFHSASKYLSLRSLYSNQNYQEVVGKIKNFETKNIYNHYKVNIFEVNNIKFSYSDIATTGGYNKIGLLTNNLYVKIRYISKEDIDLKNLILYLEVCSR
jgi:hypothetical protein